MFSNECILKVNSRLEKRPYRFHLTVKDELGQLEQKEDLKELVGACAIMNKFKVKLTERKILLFPTTVGEEFGHMERKKVLVGACAIMKTDSK